MNIILNIHSMTYDSFILFIEYYLDIHLRMYDSFILFNEYYL